MDKLETIENNMKNIKSMEVVPAWATVLINCYTELITEIRSINAINKKVTELDNACEVRGKIVDALHEDNARLNAEMENMKFSIDANEQKSRNICLLLHGIPESNDESTDNITLDTIQNEVRVSISLDDIERTHRVVQGKDLLKANIQNIVRSLFDLQACGSEWKSTQTKKILKKKTSSYPRASLT